ncbi:MAG: amidohydrolase, partial [Bacillota bacterium]
MATKKMQAIGVIDAESGLLFQMSDQLWEHPEVAFHETFAAQLYCEELERAGFQVERGLAGIPTAFSGTYGKTGPVIGFLGEFDALPNLSQEAGGICQRPVEKGGSGHGCGHNLLGVGSFAAALAVKKYLEDNQLPGTVKFFGCPAEEGGSGKGFMARDGVFDHLDIAFSWHPGDVNCVSAESTMANYQVCYHFYGVASHAAMSPELGRSALDALELMNTGTQYLREHVPSDTRIHYAITNAGGNSPGTVQAYA